MSCDFSPFQAINIDQREELIERELWVKENMAKWRKEQQEEQRTKFADSSKHKMYR